MTVYQKRIGRVMVFRDPEYGELREWTISCRDGWNENCADVEIHLSGEEIDDLLHMIKQAGFKGHELHNL